MAEAQPKWELTCLLCGVKAQDLPEMGHGIHISGGGSVLVRLQEHLMEEHRFPRKVLQGFLRVGHPPGPYTWHVEVMKAVPINRD